MKLINTAHTYHRLQYANFFTYIVSYVQKMQNLRGKIFMNPEPKSYAENKIKQQKIPLIFASS